MSKMSKAIAVLGIVAGLGVAAMPLSSYAATSKDATVPVSAKVGDAIEITSSKTNVAITNVTANAATIAEGTTKISVKTSATNGYSVTIKGATTDTALKPQGSGTPAGIPAGAPEIVAAGNPNAWGYKVANVTAGGSSSSSVAVEGDAGNYTAIVGSGGPAATLVNATGPTSTTPDTFDLMFGVTINMGIAPDTYQNSVVLTATTK